MSPNCQNSSKSSAHWKLKQNNSNKKIITLLSIPKLRANFYKITRSWLLRRKIFGKSWTCMTYNFKTGIKKLFRLSNNWPIAI
jgi:hypothetical protein